MTNNLQHYHKTVALLCQWLPRERVTRIRNMVLLLVGLQQARGIHLSQIVNQWPRVVGTLPSLINRLGRLLRNPQVEVRRWYEPLAKLVAKLVVGQTIRLSIDCTKVGFNVRMLSISIAYKKRALPLAWSIHRGHKGRVSYKAQRELLEYLDKLFGDEVDIWLLGDAGFASVHLFHWLTKHHWHFGLRHPGKNQVRWPGQPWVKLGAIPVQPAKRFPSAGSNSPPTRPLLPTG